MSNCTSGCATQDHSSYAECLHAKNMTVSGVNVTMDYRKRALWQQEIKEYRAARAQGIQPRSTRLTDIRRAVNTSNALDRPVKES